MQLIWYCWLCNQLCFEWSSVRRARLHSFTFSISRQLTTLFEPVFVVIEWSNFITFDKHSSVMMVVLIVEVLVEWRHVNTYRLIPFFTLEFSYTRFSLQGCLWRCKDSFTIGREVERDWERRGMVPTKLRLSLLSISFLKMKTYI